MMHVARSVKWWYLVLPFFLLFSCDPLLAQDEESLGRQAEQAGKLREALTHYVASLQSAPESSDADLRLREKIMGLVLKVKPAPAVPEDATTYMGRGQAAVEISKGPEDFKKAAIEFQKALKAAPWLASGYFNLGLVQDKAGQYTEAIQSFKLYLLAAPTAPDAQDVRGRIAGLEYKIQRQQEEEVAAQRAQREQERAAELEHERAEAEKVKTAQALQIVNTLGGQWENSCYAEGGAVSPSNPFEIRVRDGIFEYRWVIRYSHKVKDWDWSEWMGERFGHYFKYDTVKGVLAETHLTEGEQSHEFTVTSGSVLMEKTVFQNGRVKFCSWTRER